MYITGEDGEYELFSVKFCAGCVCAPFNVSFNDSVLEFTLIINSSSLPNNVNVGDLGQAKVTIVENHCK